MSFFMQITPFPDRVAVREETADPTCPREKPTPAVPRRKHGHDAMFREQFLQPAPLLPMAGTGEPGPARLRGLLDPPCSAPRDNVGSLADDDFAPRAGLTGLFTERITADPIVNRPRPARTRAARVLPFICRSLSTIGYPLRAMTTRLCSMDSTHLRKRVLTADRTSPTAVSSRRSR